MLAQPMAALIKQGLIKVNPSNGAFVVVTSMGYRLVHSNYPHRSKPLNTVQLDAFTENDIEQCHCLYCRKKLVKFVLTHNKLPRHLKNLHPIIALYTKGEALA